MKSLAKIFIRIMSIFFVVKSLQLIPLSITSTFMSKGNVDIYNIGVWYYISSFVLGIVVSLLLWLFADNIASGIVGKSNNDDIGFNIQSLQVVAFSVVGVVMVVNSIPTIVTNICTIYTSLKVSNDSIVLKNSIEIIGNIIKTVLGIWLIIDSTGIINLIMKLRNSVFNKIEENNDLHISDANKDSVE